MSTEVGFLNFLTKSFQKHNQQQYPSTEGKHQAKQIENEIIQCQPTLLLFAHPGVDSLVEPELAQL